MNDYKSKLKSCMQNENLFEVEDILTDILLRLPVKSLLICKSVCRYWRDLISSSTFIALHLIQSQQNPTYIYFSELYHVEMNTYKLSEIEGGEIPGSILGFDDHPNSDEGICSYGHITNDDHDEDNDMICSFNGLICCYSRHIWELPGRPSPYSYGQAYVHICNPATRKVFRLPPTPMPRAEGYVPLAAGVSFGPTILDGYKVFVFFFVEGQFLDECYVYSSITGSWKSLGYVFDRPLDNHVCISGVVYWLNRTNAENELEVENILAVDREEKFSRIRLPNEGQGQMELFLINLGGCLSVVNMDKSGAGFEIWSLEDSKESIWLKKLTGPALEELNYRNMDVHQVAARKNDLLFMGNGFYAGYDMGTSSWMKQLRRETPDETPDQDQDETPYRERFSSALAYTESLLDPLYRAH